jgi:hypothetical protein
MLFFPHLIRKKIYICYCSACSHFTVMGEFKGRRKMDEKDMKITQQPTHYQWIYMDALKKNLVELTVTLQSTALKPSTDTGI